MKRLSRIFPAILPALTGCLMSGCIHTYPHGEGIDPQNTKVSLSIILENEWQTLPYDMPLLSQPEDGSRAVGMPDYRILIQIVQDGAVAKQHQLTIPYDEVKDNVISLPDIFTLDSRPCEIAVWCDYLNPDTGDALAYDISLPSQISSTMQRGIDLYTQDALAGYASYSPMTDGHRGDGATTLKVHATPVQGRLKLIAGDYEAFMEQTRQAREKGERYTVSVSYDSELPMAYNLPQRALMAPAAGESFSTPFVTLYAPDDVHQIASDRIFSTPSPITHTLTVSVLNSAKVVVSRTPPIEVPVASGKVTTVSGPLLTWAVSGGFTIDTEWEGEIIIEI
jgi:hypothetical protein